jgi:hypothetical protein
MIRSKSHPPKRRSQSIREQCQSRIKNMPQILQRPRQNRSREQSPRCCKKQRNRHIVVLHGHHTSALFPSHKHDHLKHNVSTHSAKVIKHQIPHQTPNNNARQHTLQDSQPREPKRCLDKHIS